MADPTLPRLTQTRIFEGWWEGVLTIAEGGETGVEAWHQDRQLAGVELAGEDGRYAVKVPLPASIIGEGVQTVVMRLQGEVLTSFTLVAGLPLEEDLRAEISLLRAELDLLKRAFRRHCAETGQG